MKKRPVENHVGGFYRVLWLLNFMLLFGVGGNLLSHNLPVAVPSARRRLSFRVRNGSGRFPAAIDHRQTSGTHRVVSGLRVLCQILHSGREHDIVTMFCFLFWFCSTQRFVWC